MQGLNHIRKLSRELLNTDSLIVTDEGKVGLLKYHPLLTMLLIDTSFEDVYLQDELNSFKIKLLTVFIQFEYEEFFKLYLNRYGYEYHFETLIKNTAKLGVWGSEINFIAISLLLLRPVHCNEGFNSFSCNPLSINSVLIVLLLQESHFTAGLRCHYFAQVASPRANQLVSLKSALPQPIYYN